MSLRQSLAGAMNFAHLVSPRPAALAEPPPAPAPAAAATEPAASTTLQQDVEAAEARAAAAEARAAEAEQRAETAEEDSKKAKKAKKAAKSEDDDDEDCDGDEDSDREEAALPRTDPVRASRLRERARCAAIFADDAAGANPVLAATLAFSGDLPRGQALAILKSAGPARRSGLGERMDGNRTPPLSANPPPKPDQTDPKVLAEGILATYREARGIKK